MTSRALSLLAALASPVFLAAAVTGWLLELWPADPLTLGGAAVLVVGGPLLGIVHAATAQEREPEAAPAVVEAAPVAPLVLSPKAAAARRFAAWRETPHPALERRERERRASQYIRRGTAA